MITLDERLRGGLYGLLVGDAFGVPYEFRRATELPAREALEMVPPEGHKPTYPQVPFGTWSDDGAQALCLLASLLDKDRLDLPDFAGRLRAWARDGYMAVGGVVFDVGIQTGRALRALEGGASPEESGPAGERDNGNGSLMRSLPLALWHRGDDASLVRDAFRQSAVTHAHARSRVCCALYCLWARRLLAGDEDAFSRAAAALLGVIADLPAERAELALILSHDQPARGSGYVLDCLVSAKHALAEASYEEVVRAAVALGDDTDTTACVAGGLAGIRHGLGAIPERWLSTLRGKELVDPLATRLLAARAA